MDKNYTTAANHIRLAYKHLRDAYKILNGTLDIMVSGVDSNSFFYHPYPKTCRLAQIGKDFDIEKFLKTALWNWRRMSNG